MLVKSIWTANKSESWELYEGPFSDHVSELKHRSSVLQCSFWPLDRFLHVLFMHQLSFHIQPLDYRTLLSFTCRNFNTETCLAPPASCLLSVKLCHNRTKSVEEFVEAALFLCAGNYKWKNYAFSMYFGFIDIRENHFKWLLVEICNVYILFFETLPGKSHFLSASFSGLFMAADCWLFLI